MDKQKKKELYNWLKDDLAATLEKHGFTGAAVSAMKELDKSLRHLAKILVKEQGRLSRKKQKASAEPAKKEAGKAKVTKSPTVRKRVVKRARPVGRKTSAKKSSVKKSR